MRPYKIIIAIDIHNQLYMSSGYSPYFCHFDCNYTTKESIILLHMPTPQQYGGGVVVNEYYTGRSLNIGLFR